jgi:hypothetical protein
MTAYRELIERLERSTGPDRIADCLLFEMQWKEGEPLGPPAYTASIDAALSLVEKMLPDWGRCLYWNNCQGHTARLEDNANAYTGSTGADFEARGATAPIALLIALLRALEAQSKDKEEGEA